MLATIQNRLATIENELKALKTSSPLNIGALRAPESVPTVSYSGTFGTASQDYVTARLAATFTRTDGGDTAPLVDFAYNASISPTYQEFRATQGFAISGNDPNALVEVYTRGYEVAADNNSVTFYLDFLNAVAPYYGASATLSATIQALSTVKGSLTLRRLI